MPSLILDAQRDVDRDEAGDVAAGAAEAAEGHRALHEAAIAGDELHTAALAMALAEAEEALSVAAWCTARAASNIAAVAARLGEPAALAAGPAMERALFFAATSLEDAGRLLAACGPGSSEDPLERKDENPCR